jgi:hypothetical protein
VGCEKTAIISIEWRCNSLFSLTGNSTIRNREFRFPNSDLFSGYQRKPEIRVTGSTDDEQRFSGAPPLDRLTAAGGFVRSP